MHAFKLCCQKLCGSLIAPLERCLINKGILTLNSSLTAHLVSEAQHLNGNTPNHLLWQNIFGYFGLAMVTQDVIEVQLQILLITTEVHCPVPFIYNLAWTEILVTFYLWTCFTS